MIRFCRPVVLLAAVLTVAACGTASGDEVETTTVESPSGSVELPVEPLAALGMYTTDVDILIALGYPLADAQPIRAEYDTLPAYLPADAIEDVEPFANYPEFDYERIASVAPDFILNSLAYEEATLSRLPEIAPTYSYNGFDGTSWRVHFERTARDLGRTEQYDEWTARYEERLAEVREALGGKVDELVVTPASYFDGQVILSCQALCSVFDDLGIEIYEGARADGGKGVRLSVEELGQLNDVDMVVTSKTPNSEDTGVTGLNDVALWNSLPLVQQGQIYAFDRELIFGSPSGQMALLDEVEKSLT